MTKTVLVCLTISLVLRIILGYVQKDIWKIKIYKYYIFVPLMTVIGTFGSKLLSKLAYDSFAGNRLYGTVIILAIAIPIMAILLCIPIKTLYGFSSVGTWLSIAVMKVSCVIDGCCYGIIISSNADGLPIRFPSQLCETIVAALFFVWFYILSKKNYPKALMYPLLMFWYGIYRYAFDWLRGNKAEVMPFVLWIPAGRFFSIVIFLAGAITLYVVSKKLFSKNFNYKVFIDSILGRLKENE